MKEEILQRLDALAAKLNTTAEHLWGVLVVQGKIEGIYGLIYCSVAFAFLVAGLIAIASGVRHLTDSENGDDDLGSGLAILGSIISVPSLIFFIGCIEKTKYLFNPEYFALQEVLKAIQ